MEMGSGQSNARIDSCTQLMYGILVYCRKIRKIQAAKGSTPKIIKKKQSEKELRRSLNLDLISQKCLLLHNYLISIPICKI